MLIELHGNLFNSDAQALINTVNCVGVMGKGIALEFRRRYPKMYEAYRRVCRNRNLHPGQILPYTKSDRVILNLAVKNHWQNPSRMEWVEACLERFVLNYKRLGITSAAFPWIGAMNGGLPWEPVHNLMRQYLSSLHDIRVEIIGFDPDIPDPLFKRLIQSVQTLDPSTLARHVGISKQDGELVYQAINAKTPSLTRLCEYPGLGRDAVESLYTYFR